MKKKRLIVLLGTASVLSLAAFTVVSSNGSQVGYTVSPPDGPGDCSGCHHGGSATPVVNFTAVPAFGAGNTYVPGTTYTVSMNITGYPKFGFDLEMINGQLSTPTDAGTGFANVASTRITAPGSFPTCTNMSHSTPLASSAKASWKWVAPASGTVYVYAAAMGVNGDGSTGGDKCIDYTTTLVVSPTAVAEHSNTVSEFNLFPNPLVDNNVHLSYSLDKTSTVTIQLFDLSGKLVADLLNQTQDAGGKTFDTELPATLSKGIYNVCIAVDGQRLAKRLIIK